MSFFRWLTARFTKPKTRQARSRTVRYMFPAVIGGVTAFALFSSTITSTDSYLYISVPNQAVEVGAIVPVTVKANAAVPINAIEATLVFDENSVEVFGVDRGQSVITIWTEDPVVTDTAVSLRGGTFKRGFIGDHDVATINLRALTTGQHTVALEQVRLIAGDGAGTEVTAVDVPASSLALFNFDETTSEEEIAIAVTSNLPTDVTGDGQVTMQDISAFMGSWSSQTNTFDFNGDGMMTFRDFSILLAAYFFQE